MDPIRSVRNDFRTGWRLSKAATQDVDSPSLLLSGTSVGMLRTVRVTGAMTIHVSTEVASLRVTISTGRRLSSASAHQISP